MQYVDHQLELRTFRTTVLLMSMKSKAMSQANSVGFQHGCDHYCLSCSVRCTHCPIVFSVFLLKYSLYKSFRHMLQNLVKFWGICPSSSLGDLFQTPAETLPLAPTKRLPSLKVLSLPAKQKYFLWFQSSVRQFQKHCVAQVSDLSMS